jgi:cytochrome P450
MQHAQPPSCLDFDPATRRLRLDPHDPRFIQHPYEAYRWLHGQGSTFFWEDYGLWCFGGFEDVGRLFRDRRLGRQSPAGIPDRIVGNDRSHLRDFDAVEMHSMLELEPPVHTRLRTLVNRAFVSREVERLRPRIETVASELLDRLERGRPVDLLANFASPLPIAMIAGMLGVPVEMGSQLLDWSHRMVRMYMHGRTRAIEDDANRAAREFSAFLRVHIAERRRRPGDDLLSSLIAAQADGQTLSEDELVSATILLLNAGHEATVHQLGNGVAAILAQGGDPRRYFATPELCAGTIEECLRFDPPLHMFTRYAYDGISGGGIEVPPGGQIGLLLGMANHDPLSFRDPSAFRPGREDKKNISFGAGIHFCVGAPLARLELQVALSVLFDRFPHLRIVEPPRYRDSYHFHGLERLVVNTSGGSSGAELPLSWPGE